MKVREVIKLLREDGWYLVNQEGSHRQFKHPTKPGRVTVAGKPGETLHPKTLASILRQAKLQKKGDD
ncbi:MAG: type II toxin-antitoxin system HicA family toxin [Pelotomaculum sp.]|nr:type II toxin-antitoxin system HicA family toxin [Pelotomaculum sp.]